MMTEDWIKKNRRRFMNLTGREMSPDELAREFARCDLRGRADILDEMACAEEEDRTPRETAERMGYTRAMLSTHERLRKAGR
jgi:hypothetical protein